MYCCWCVYWCCCLLMVFYFQAQPTRNLISGYILESHSEWEREIIYTSDLNRDPVFWQRCVFFFSFRVNSTNNKRFPNWIRSIEGQEWWKKGTGTKESELRTWWNIDVNSLSMEILMIWRRFSSDWLAAIMGYMILRQYKDISYWTKSI